MSSLTNALFLVSIYGKWFPWEFTDGHIHWVMGGGGDFHVWFNQSIFGPLCMIEVYGIFNLKKNIQFHY